MLANLECAAVIEQVCSVCLGNSKNLLRVRKDDRSICRNCLPLPDKRKDPPSPTGGILTQFDDYDFQRAEADRIARRYLGVGSVLDLDAWLRS